MPKQKNILLDLEQIKSETDSRFICKPLDSLSEIMLFLEQPPPWRTLCKELTPHSDFLIRNIEINKHSVFHSFDQPEIFCHFDPDVEEPKRYESKSLPKTLVCHDMANGYHDDCIIDGTRNSEAYTFYNWAGIDIFCYFSHHLITIPPLGWINVGHAHGVKVIGTIITEWSQGAEFWDEMLSSELQYQNVASALVAIAKTLKFDGYLLNVENKIAVPEMMLKFVRYFYRLLHEELPHATLLWYDSVTIKGNLNWQNKLCDKNLAFFEACDGLFTNYSWSPKDVETSAVKARESGRLTDLYIGVDVWGRNFFGGGQFNTKEAIKLVHAAGCSIALFAPAWTHEALSNESSDQNRVAMADNLDTYGRFLLRDRALWGSIWPFLNTRLPSHIPFQTSFCRGQGIKRWHYGEMLCPSPWFNLRHQQYQPNAAHGPHGYLLTSIEHLAKVKNEVQYKDKKGIMRIRASFLQARSALLGVNNVSMDSQPVARATAESVVSELGNESRDRADPNEKSTVKVIKNIFKEKIVKISESQVESTPATKESAASSTPATKEPSASSTSATKESAASSTPATKEPSASSTSAAEELTASSTPATKEPTASSTPAIKEPMASSTPATKEPVASSTPATKEPVASSTPATKEPVGSSTPATKEPSASSTSAAEGLAASSTPATEELAASRMDNNSLTYKPSVNLDLRLSRKDAARYGLAYVAEERQCLQLHHGDAFLGGASLMVHPSDDICVEHRYTRLLHCDFPCDEGLIICVVTKNVLQHPLQTLNVKLNMRNAADRYLTVVLTGRPLAQRNVLDGSSSGIMYVYPLLTADEDVLRQLRTYLLLTQPGFYVPIDNQFGWTVRYYEIRVPGSRITSVNLRTGVPVGPILLGQLSIWRKTKDDSWMGFFERPVEKVKGTNQSTASTTGTSTGSDKDQCVAL